MLCNTVICRALVAGSRSYSVSNVLQDYVRSVLSLLLWNRHPETLIFIHSTTVNHIFALYSQASQKEIENIIQHLKKVIFKLFMQEL